MHQFISNNVFDLHLGVVKVRFFSRQQAELADRLRIIFHVFESVSLSSYPCSLKDQLFGPQPFLWQKKATEEPLDYSLTHEFPFVIQFPAMVQYPPSIIDAPDCLYQCRYKLSAFLEPKQPAGSKLSKQRALAIAEEPIIYMPFIEARAQKSEPLVLEGSGQSLKVSIRLADLEYLPGDIVPATIYLEQDKDRKQKDRAAVDMGPIKVCMKLHQIVSILPGKPQQSQQSRILGASEMNLPASASGVISLSLRIPEYIPPSFDFGRLSSIYYKLSFHIKRSAKSSFKRLLSVSPCISIDEAPIRIGSFGYGLQAPEGLRAYSEYKPVFKDSTPTSTTSRDDPLPVPSFVRVEESDAQEEKLPAYEPYQLPAYDQALHYPTMSSSQPIC